jgi:hypothetical protein
MRIPFLLGKVVCMALFIFVTNSLYGQKDEEYLTKTKRNKTIVSNVELRLRLGDFLAEYTLQLEEFTDRVYYSSSDYAIKKNVLQWRIYGISAMSRAINISDPFLAFYNGWPLTKQTLNYFETGAGQESFGEYQIEAIAMCENFENMFDSMLVHSMNLEELEIREPFVTQYAIDNPIKNLYFTRSSSLNYFAKWIAEQQMGIKGNVNTLTEEIQEMSNRLNFYADLIPRQARWQAEYAMINFLDDTTFSNKMGKMMNNMDLLTQLALQTPEIIDYNRDIMLNEMDRQRIEITTSLSLEREELINAYINERSELFKIYKEERTFMLNELKGERAIVMAQVENLSGNMMESVGKQMRDLIDIIFLRLIALVLLIGILAFLLLRFFRKI